METIAVTPEQGRQIVQHLDDFIFEFLRCVKKRWPPRGSIPGLKKSFHWLDPSEEDLENLDEEWKEYWKEYLEEEKCYRELSETKKLADQVKAQVEQGHVEKQLLIELNEKLGKLQENYGNILIFSATVAAIISGLKDLIDLLLGQ